MEGNVVSAAKSLGICLIVSSLILVLGIYISMNKCSKRMASSIGSAGHGSGSRVQFPNQIEVRLLPHSGSFNVNLNPNNSPLNIELKQK